jgi:redox-sensing transcriptional repressor
MDKASKIPDPTIERLAMYTRPLEVLLKSNTILISSEKLAKLCGVSSAQVRKDLAYFGEFGVRGVGYHTRDLLREIKKILATDRRWTLCIVGVGHLGSALVENENFMKRGYRFVAAFDSDQKKIGKILPCGLIIESDANIRQVVSSRHIEIGVITTPRTAAQRVADLLIDAGVRAILNFAPIQVRSTEHCPVENVDFTVKLENLAYHLGKII